MFIRFVLSNYHDEPSSQADTLVTMIHQLHIAGVVHGDLVSRNVMLMGDSKEGSGSSTSPSIPRIVLVDFGLARPVDSGQEDELTNAIS